MQIFKDDCFLICNRRTSHRFLRTVVFSFVLTYNLFCGISGYKESWKIKKNCNRKKNHNLMAQTLITNNLGYFFPLFSPDLSFPPFLSPFLPPLPTSSPKQIQMFMCLYKQFILNIYNSVYYMFICANYLLFLFEPQL